MQTHPLPTSPENKPPSGIPCSLLQQLLCILCSLDYHLTHALQPTINTVSNMLRGSLRLPTCRPVATCAPQRLVSWAPARRCSTQSAHASNTGSVSLGGHEFDSLVQVRSMFRELLQVHQPGEVVAHEDDADLLLALLMRHPRAEVKIGPGISHFSVGTSVHSLTGQQTQHFVLHRVDGTCSDFSYLKCLATMNAGFSSVSGE